MLSMIRKFRKNEKGATMIEYALLASLISIGAIVTLQLIGPQVNTTFVKVKDALSPAAP